MRRIVSAILILISEGSVSEIVLPPEFPLSDESVVLEAGKEMLVPSCTRWLVKDIRKFNDLTWLHIQGKIEVKPNNWDKGQAKYIEGSFDFKTGESDPESILIIYPESTVTFWSKEGYSTHEVMEYIWDFDLRC